ncbi:MAG: EF-hand domain-containing protein [Luteolibacter sp.]
MKTTSLIIIAASFGILGAASAKPEGRPEGRPQGGPDGRKIPEAIIAKFDKDGDGKLNEEEREALKAHHEQMKAKILAEFDADKDGKLSEDERAAMKAAVIAKYDADGDGKLSEEERKAAREEYPMMPGHGPGAHGDKERPVRPGGNSDRPVRPGGGDREAPGAGE